MTSTTRTTRSSGPRTTSTPPARPATTRALYAYNHALPYVSAVLLYARRMANDPRAFFEYYNWQVFVLTATGDRRLTGPGASGTG